LGDWFGGFGGVRITCHAGDGVDSKQQISIQKNNTNQIKSTQQKKDRSVPATVRGAVP